jgi:hypothetical protein
VKDVISETLFSRVYRACKEWNNWTGRGQFLDRMDLVRQIMTLTIEHGWPVGFGPGGAPYGKCADDFSLVETELGGKTASMFRQTHSSQGCDL